MSSMLKGTNFGLNVEQKSSSECAAEKKKKKKSAAVPLFTAVWILHSAMQ